MSIKSGCKSRDVIEVSVVSVIVSNLIRHTRSIVTKLINFELFNENTPSIQDPKIYAKLYSTFVKV